jgi:hypothetical protein
MESVGGEAGLSSRGKDEENSPREIFVVVVVVVVEQEASVFERALMS